MGLRNFCYVLTLLPPGHPYFTNTCLVSREFASLSESFIYAKYKVDKYYIDWHCHWSFRIRNTVSITKSWSTSEPAIVTKWKNQVTNDVIELKKESSVFNNATITLLWKLKKELGSITSINWSCDHVNWPGQSREWSRLIKNKEAQSTQLKLVSLKNQRQHFIKKIYNNDPWKLSSAAEKHYWSFISVSNFVIAHWSWLNSSSVRKIPSPEGRAIDLAILYLN